MKKQKTSQLTDSHNQLSILSEAKKLQHLSSVAEAEKDLGEKSFKNYSSLTRLNKCPTISERRQCESSLYFLNKDPESRDI